MIGGKTVLGLIPARGGSKGLPGKNIRPLLGKPLIAWTIEAAKSSGYIDAIVVSTDDDAIAAAAREWGAEVPFMRPAELAADGTPTIDVIMHALAALKQAGWTFDILALLEPTSPLREAEDIDHALELLLGTSGAESVVGVAKVEGMHPSFLVGIEGHFIRPFAPAEFGVRRRQDLDPLYYFEGSVYISEVASLVRRRSFYHERTAAYLVPRYKSFEIDELCDFIIVEALMNARAQGTLQT